jgi:hypothetical protein
MAGMGAFTVDKLHEAVRVVQHPPAPEPGSRPDAFESCVTRWAATRVLCGRSGKRASLVWAYPPRAVLAGCRSQHSSVHVQIPTEPDDNELVVVRLAWRPIAAVEGRRMYLQCISHRS